MRIFLLFLFLLVGRLVGQSVNEQHIQKEAQKYFQQYLSTIYKNKKSFTIYGVAVSAETLKEHTTMLNALIDRNEREAAADRASRTPEELKRVQRRAMNDRKKLKSYFMEISDIENSGVRLYYCVADVSGTLKNGKKNTAYYELLLGESGELIIYPRESL